MVSNTTERLVTPFCTLGGWSVEIHTGCSCLYRPERAVTAQVKKSRAWDYVVEVNVHMRKRLKARGYRTIGVPG
jgi:hypothetical protein